VEHIYSQITGTGIGIPERSLSNFDLEKMVDTSDEWIRTRTGIENRYIAAECENTSDLCTRAAQMALQNANVTPDQVDVIIVASITGDVGFPATAIFVQDKIGANNAAAFDISAACSGFIYGLELADLQIKTGKAKNVLVIGGEILSRIVDYTDRNTCVLFGDGAGAVVLQASDTPGVLGTFIKSDGRLNDLLKIDGFGTKFPPSHKSVDEKRQFLIMAGKEVFKHAVTCMGDAAQKILELTNLSSDQIDLLITHQANQRIIDATARRVNITEDRVFVNVNKYGNTSAASIPIALHEALQQGKIKKGSKVALVAFGGGFTWGSAAVQF